MTMPSVATFGPQSANAATTSKPAANDQTGDNDSRFRDLLAGQQQKQAADPRTETTNNQGASRHAAQDGKPSTKADQHAADKPFAARDAEHETAEPKTKSRQRQTAADAQAGHGAGQAGARLAKTGPRSPSLVADAARGAQHKTDGHDPSAHGRDRVHRDHKDAATAAPAAAPAADTAQTTTGTQHAEQGLQAKRGHVHQLPGQHPRNATRHPAARARRDAEQPREARRVSVETETVAKPTVQVAPETPNAAQDPAQALARTAKTHNSTRNLGALAAVTGGGHQPAPAANAQTVAAPQSATAVVNATIDAAPASAQWNQAITQQSLRLAHNGGGRAELTLHPPSLGTLHVSLQLGHNTQIHFASPHAEVRTAVQAALPQLEDAFVEAGINLGQTSVGDQQPQQSTGDEPGERRATAEADPDAQPESLRITRIAGRTPSGGIDIFA